MLQTSSREQRSTDSSANIDVELRQAFKVFDGETAVGGVNLNVRKGEFFSILGPSGCGKTTVLRLIAGFETLSAGKVFIQNQLMNNAPPYRRPVNTVFQSYALFNHLTVAENVAFGLKVKRLNKLEVENGVKEALASVQMESYSNRFPNQLSGGQQQRVALARALVNRPAVLLLDEPLGALDLKLRKEMQVELSRLHQELRLTFIMVTHDQEEALSLSDRIAVMRSGKIEQIGHPNEVYERPRTPFVADFIGDTNLFEGFIEASDASFGRIVTNRGLELIVQLPETEELDRSSLHKKVIVSIRPEKIKLSLEPPTGEHNCLEGRLKHVMYLGTHVHYVVELVTGDSLTVMQPNMSVNLPQADTPVYVHWSARDCLALDDW